MRALFTTSCATLGLIASTLASATQPHAGHDPVARAHKIGVHDCWIRQLPGNLPSAAYFRITNAGSEPAALTAVETDAHARVMLHTTTTAQGMSHMHHVERVSVPAHGHLDFSPGGYHVMLEQATRKLAVGQVLPLAFVFAQGEPVQADCTVRAANAIGGTGVGQPHGHDHGHAGHHQPHKH